MDHPPSKSRHRSNCNCSSEPYSRVRWVEIPDISHLPGYKFLCIHWGARNCFCKLYSDNIILKRSGGQRHIENPHPILKIHQRYIMDLLDSSARYHDCCHGFRKGHSIKTNAFPHVGKDVIMNLDIKDFFSSIEKSRVMELFRSLGYRVQGGRLNFMTSLVTRYDRLPQGAPTSPVIANLICYNLDKKISEIVESEGGSYTRYADDITISGNVVIQKTYNHVKKIIMSEGFFLNDKKTRIQRKGKRQEVTGLTVNEKITVPRHIRKKLRAAIHARTIGKQPMWNGNEISDVELKGHIDYLTSIQEEYIEKYNMFFKS